MKALDLIVWVWTMPAMPEIGIMQSRPQRHLCQVLERRRWYADIEFRGRRITVKTSKLEEMTVNDAAQGIVDILDEGLHNVFGQIGIDVKNRVLKHNSTARGVL